MALTNAQYEEIMREYDAKRQRANALLSQRRDSIYDSIPEIKEVDDSIARAAFDAARARISNKDYDPDELEATINAFIADRRELLKSNGYPEDYLDIKYDCELCQDTGFIDGEKCTCLKSAEIKLLYGRYDKGGALKKENFDTFNFDYYPDDEPDLHTGKTPLGNAQAAFDAAEYTADHIGSPDSHLFIHGPTGVGKTFLAHCIAKQALDSSKPALVLSASEFVEILEKATFGHDETFKDTSNSLLTCDVLVIDDLGTEFVNSFVLKELFRVLVHRIENNKTTVISTNLSLPEIRDLYSERIFSRIMSQFNIIKLTGDDIRLAKKLSGGQSDTAI